jgi:hypothetical protein
MKDNWEKKNGDAGNDYRRIQSFYKELMKDVSFISSERNRTFDPRLEMLIVEVDEGEIMPFYMLGLMESKIDVPCIKCVPQYFPEIQSYLGLLTDSLSEKEAISLGEGILKQACLFNLNVGPPEYHGYDVIKVSRSGDFSHFRKEPVEKRKDPMELLESIRLKIENKEESK